MGQSAPIEPEVNPTTGTETETETTNSGYVKQTWSTGDVITADKMNHIEDGIGNISTGGVFYVTFTPEVTEEHIGSVSSDKTFNQIKAAYDAGQVIMARLLGASTGASVVEITPLVYTSFRNNGGAFGFMFTNTTSRNIPDTEEYEMYSYTATVMVVKEGDTESIQFEEERASWPCEIYGEELNA